MTYLCEHEGVPSFKFFMAYPGNCYSDDGQILRAMQNCSESGGLVMMHAENGIAIDVLVAQALARGETDPRYHSFTRPPELEGEATHRAVVLAKVAGNVPLYIVHMSASEALDEVAEVAVIGRPDAEWGQIVTAVVVPTDPGSPPGLEALREAVRSILPAFCAPRRLELVTALPRTPLGKVLRRSL